MPSSTQKVSALVFLTRYDISEPRGALPNRRCCALRQKARRLTVREFHSEDRPIPLSIYRFRRELR
jgi:hypothetical protein